MTDDVTVSRADIEDLMQALATYQHMALNEGNIWGQQDARNLLSRVQNHAHGIAYAFIHLWFGRNHQRFAPGDQARYSEYDSKAEGAATAFHPCTILVCYTHGALVEDHAVGGTEWMAWHTLHRLDRLHSEPTFDVANYAAIVEHMELGYDPAGFPDPVAPLFLAPAGLDAVPQRSVRLSVVKDGA